MTGIGCSRGRGEGIESKFHNTLEMAACGLGQSS